MNNNLFNQIYKESDSYSRDRVGKRLYDDFDDMEDDNMSEELNEGLVGSAVKAAGTAVKNFFTKPVQAVKNASANMEQGLLNYMAKSKTPATEQLAKAMNVLYNDLMKAINLNNKNLSKNPPKDSSTDESNKDSSKNESIESFENRLLEALLKDDFVEYNRILRESDEAPTAEPENDSSSPVDANGADTDPKDSNALNNIKGKNENNKVLNDFLTKYGLNAGIKSTDQLEEYLKKMKNNEEVKSFVNEFYNLKKGDGKPLFNPKTGESIVKALNQVEAEQKAAATRNGGAAKAPETANTNKNKDGDATVDTPSSDNEGKTEVAKGSNVSGGDNLTSDDATVNPKSSDGEGQTEVAKDTNVSGEDNFTDEDVTSANAGISIVQTSGGENAEVMAQALTKAVNIAKSGK